MEGGPGGAAPSEGEFGAGQGVALRGEAAVLFGEVEQQQAAEHVALRFLLGNWEADSVVGGEIRQASQATLRMSRSTEFFPGTTDRVMCIAGPLQNVVTALLLVFRKIQEAAGPGTHTTHDSTHDQAPHTVAPQQAAPATATSTAGATPAAATGTLSSRASADPGRHADASTRSAQQAAVVSFDIPGAGASSAAASGGHHCGARNRASTSDPGEYRGAPTPPVTATLPAQQAPHQEHPRPTTLPMGPVGPDSYTQVRLLLPAALCGVIIGQSGTTIKEISAQCGVTISLSPQDRMRVRDYDRVATVSGARDNVLRAIIKIASRLLATSYGSAHFRRALTGPLVSPGSIHAAPPSVASAPSAQGGPTLAPLNLSGHSHVLPRHSQPQPPASRPILTLTQQQQQQHQQEVSIPAQPRPNVPRPPPLSAPPLRAPAVLAQPGLSAVALSGGSSGAFHPRGRGASLSGQLMPQQVHSPAMHGLSALVSVPVMTYGFMPYLPPHAAGLNTATGLALDALMRPLAPGSQALPLSSPAPGGVLFPAGPPPGYDVNMGHGSSMPGSPGMAMATAMGTGTGSASLLAGSRTMSDASASMAAALTMSVPTPAALLGELNPASRRQMVLALPIPELAVGTVIGRSGVRLRQFKEVFAVKVVVADRTQMDPTTHTRNVYISGTQENAMRACQHVAAIARECLQSAGHTWEPPAPQVL